jgi:hypothetical protein
MVLPVGSISTHVPFARYILLSLLHLGCVTTPLKSTSILHQPRVHILVFLEYGLSPLNHLVCPHHDNVVNNGDGRMSPALGDGHGVTVAYRSVRNFRTDSG